jgi:long-chain acyl-CoA synthetase
VIVVVLTRLATHCTRSLVGALGSDTVGSRFLAVAGQSADRPAVITSSQSYTYGAISAAALRVATYLGGRVGFSVGARVALLADNGPEYLAAFYGIVLAGGVVVPLPAHFDTHLLREVLADADLALLITDPQHESQLTASLNAQVEELDLMAPPPVHMKLPNDTAQDRGRAALMLYTSGSTGKPKGVLLSHGNILSNAESILGYLPIQPADRALALLPFCHAFGNSVLQTHILSGATLVVDGSTTFPNTVVDALERHRANSFAGVPEMYSGLLKCSDLGVRKLPHLRYMSVAGAAIAPATALAVAERIAPAELFVMYGQTEATARLAYLSSDQLRRRPSSIGKAVPNVELQVRNQEGVSVGIGETGELCARGPNIMLGYWRDPIATAHVLKDGWLRTGDIATVDQDSFFYVLGRARDQVKIRGLNVTPGAVAETLCRHLPECEIAVVPFQCLGSWRLALFVATSNQGPDLLRRVGQVCADSLARHQRPSYLEVLERLPLTPSLKLDRHALAQRATQRSVTRSAIADCSSAAALKEAV